MNAKTLGDNALFTRKLDLNLRKTRENDIF
jgi:hypothetical protein